MEKIKISLGKSLCAFGQISIVINGPILKNILAIWSHWQWITSSGKLFKKWKFIFCGKSFFRPSGAKHFLPLSRCSLKMTNLVPSNSVLLSIWFKAVAVVAQLVEWLLPTPEIRSSNPTIGKCHLHSNESKRPKN